MLYNILAGLVLGFVLIVLVYFLSVIQMTAWVNTFIHAIQSYDKKEKQSNAEKSIQGSSRQ